ncbi:MAG TPA: glycosyltransferase family 2 protein [Actinomycetota bacterium]|nr:glycosyltransferase family 2 protein [Actinomycetota bacterium]
MDPQRSGSAFIIATRNRPDELLTSVESIVGQTVLPAELCIVDSSDETPARAKIEELCAGVGLSLDYHHPAPRGLTIQRNIGIGRTTGDPVFFVDDDVFLDPACHEEILAEYARWGPELGGVRATPKHPARPPLISILWRKLFGIGGWWPEASGKMRAGFWVEGVSIAAGVRKLEYMTGWFMSFKREVFEHELFDEKLSGYGHKEDVDFTYRVSKRYVLLQTPKAICDHFQTVTSRLPSHQLMRMNLGNQFYLHRKNMPQDARHRVALWWGLLGLFVLNVGRAAFKNDWGLVTGMIVGAFEQARGKGLVDPAAERAAA